MELLKACFKKADCLAGGDHKFISVVIDSIGSDCTIYTCGAIEEWQNMLLKCFTVGADGKVALRIVVGTVRSADAEDWPACGETSEQPFEWYMAFPYCTNAAGEYCLYLGVIT